MVVLFPCFLGYVFRQAILRLREAPVLIYDCELFSNVVVKPGVFSRATSSKNEANYRLNIMLLADVSVSVSHVAATRLTE